MSKENNVESKSVLEKAILEYKQILEVAKNKIVESHSKELNAMITKLINENDLSQNEEPVMVNEESQLNEMVNNEEEFEVDMKEASMKEIEEAFDAASDEDEFKVVKNDDNNDDFSLSDIEGEISEVMSEIDAAENLKDQDVAETKVDNLTKIKQIHEEMGKMIEAMDNEKNEIAMKEQFHAKMTETFGEGYDQKFGIDECGKMYETWKSTFMPTSGVPGTHNPESAAEPSSVQTSVPEKQIEFAESEKSVEEQHGVGLSVNKLVPGNKTPRVEFKPYAKDKIRLALRKESNEMLQKRINSLVNENFELTKAANKAKEMVNEMTKINESYKEAITKYRKQLNEMALVSTNIANVNNILVNESLALSFEDKKNIINDFKKVTSVEESEKTYKKIIKEYSEAKKTIKESVEQKISSTAIEPSSSEEVKRSVEGDSINEHVNKIKSLINYKHKN